MKVTVLLADKGTNNPQGGTLNLLNVGWTRTVLRPAPMVPGGFLTPPLALAVFFEVEHSHCNHPIDLVIRLVNQDGQPVQVPGAAGTQPLVITQTMTVMSPAGAPIGAPGVGNALIEILPGLIIAPGNYRWEVTLDGDHDADWEASFQVVAPPQMGFMIGAPPVG